MGGEGGRKPSNATISGALVGVQGPCGLAHLSLGGGVLLSSRLISSRVC
jgi:hypothetical protein